MKGATHSTMLNLAPYTVTNHSQILAPHVHRHMELWRPRACACASSLDAIHIFAIPAPSDDRAAIRSFISDASEKTVRSTAT